MTKYGTASYRSKTHVATLLTLSLLALATPAPAQDMINYFLPMPSNRMSSATWGAAAVLPRALDNGLEPSTKTWLYWDGKIIKDPDGKYHLFASRWAESLGHYAWAGSTAIHAVSNTPTGPYVDTGAIYTNGSGRGHNITGGVLPDGRYYVVASDAGRAGDIFVSSTIDGQFAFLGTISLTANGQDLTNATANVSIIVRPDGNFLMVSRPGIVMLSTTGILGPYVAQGPSVWPTIAGYDNAYAEDPALWYSGGLYHITVNYWDIRKARHLVSTDGLKNWRDTGLAYDPTANFLRHTDGTINHWTHIERPGVLIENGQVTHFTLSVVDVWKWEELGNDNHGSKVLVVPFDGAKFDAALGATGVGGAAGGGASAGGAASGGTSAQSTSTGGVASGGTSAQSTSTGGVANGGTSAQSTSTGGVSKGGTSARSTTSGGAANGGTSAANTLAGGAVSGGTSAVSFGGGTVNSGGAITGAGTLGVGGAPGGTAVVGGAAAGGQMPAATDSPASNTNGEDGSCSCRVAGQKNGSFLQLFGLAGLLSLARTRRRSRGLSPR